MNKLRIGDFITFFGKQDNDRYFMIRRVSEIGCVVQEISTKTIFYIEKNNDKWGVHHENEILRVMHG